MDSTCWCGETGTYLVPVDPEVTDPTHKMRNGSPALLVCDDHMDRDGYERFQPSTDDGAGFDGRYDTFGVF
jgi:hypothetical protein